MSKLAQYNKTIVTVLGLILLVGSDVANNLNNLLPAQWIVALNVALGLMTAFLAFWVRNEQMVEDLSRDVAQPSLGHSVDAVAKVSELVAGVRAEVADVKAQMVPPPAPVSVVVNTPAAVSAPAAAQEAPVPDPAPEPSAPTGIYPDGPYVPPVADAGNLASVIESTFVASKPAYTGPVPPVSEPVGATAVSATP